METILKDKLNIDATDTVTGNRDKGDKYLTFQLDGEEYGVEILKVREIMGLMEITTVPRMPAFLKGVINLRGKVTPVIDLRLKFGMKEIEYTDQTCIIVVDVGNEIGIIVDTVSEVLKITGDNIASPPSMGGSVDTSFIMGMGKVGEAIKILLDIEKVLSSDEFAELEDAIETNPVSQPDTDTSSARPRDVALT